MLIFTRGTVYVSSATSFSDGAEWHGADGLPKVPYLVLSWALMKKHIVIFQYERREESAVWQIDVCSQGGPLHYMYRIDVAGGGGVCVWVCVCGIVFMCNNSERIILTSK